MDSWSTLPVVHKVSCRISIASRLSWFTFYNRSNMFKSGLQAGQFNTWTLTAEPCCCITYIMRFGWNKPNFDSSDHRTAFQLALLHLKWAQWRQEYFWIWFTQCMVFSLHGRLQLAFVDATRWFDCFGSVLSHTEWCHYSIVSVFSVQCCLRAWRSQLSDIGLLWPLGHKWPGAEIRFSEFFYVKMDCRQWNAQILYSLIKVILKVLYCLSMISLI